MCHCPVTDENSPYIGACFGNHQHADKWDGVCPKYDRYIESKAQKLWSATSSGTRLLYALLPADLKEL